MDLVAVLLSRHYGATFAELRAEVPGYFDGNADSVRRAFERDKDDLRALGVALETVGTPGDAESRYRLRPGDFYLPYLLLASERGLTTPRRVDADGYRALAEREFSSDELGLLADAARRAADCGDPILANDARHALAKLFLDVGAGALQPTPGVTVAAPLAAADPGHLKLLGDALARRKQVTFTYHGIERDEAERRTVLPYGLAYTSGHWYLHAHDPARGAIRRFRLHRMRELEINGKAPRTKDYEIPPDFSLAAAAEPVPAWALGDDAAVRVALRFSADNGMSRTARAFGHADPSMPGVVHYDVRRREVFLRWVLGMAGDAAPIAPPEVVREWEALVQRTLAVHGVGVAE
jgi:predicted DNA-binding transcriptional regulator YafY